MPGEVAAHIRSPTAVLEAVVLPMAVQAAVVFDMIAQRRFRQVLLKLEYRSWLNKIICSNLT